eukprot:GHVN01012141.1.p1 GENE.GHVN01012141.1~~GHVN01012141.1.p1  ORF type:complete len:1049 (+),score=88.21 GHVN01012141.1:159-3149(+)
MACDLETEGNEAELVCVFFVNHLFRKNEHQASLWKLLQPAVLLCESRNPLPGAGAEIVHPLCAIPVIHNLLVIKGLCSFGWENHLSRHLEVLCDHSGVYPNCTCRTPYTLSGVRSLTTTMVAYSFLEACESGTSFSESSLLWLHWLLCLWCNQFDITETVLLQSDGAVNQPPDHMKTVYNFEIILMILEGVNDWCLMTRVAAESARRTDNGGLISLSLCFVKLVVGFLMVRSAVLANHKPSGEYMKQLIKACQILGCTINGKPTPNEDQVTSELIGRQGEEFVEESSFLARGWVNGGQRTDYQCAETGSSHQPAIDLINEFSRRSNVMPHEQVGYGMVTVASIHRYMSARNVQHESNLCPLCLNSGAAVSQSGECGAREWRRILQRSTNLNVCPVEEGSCLATDHPYLLLSDGVLSSAEGPAGAVLGRLSSPTSSPKRIEVTMAQPQWPLWTSISGKKATEVVRGTKLVRTHDAPVQQLTNISIDAAQLEQDTEFVLDMTGRSKQGKVLLDNLQAIASPIRRLKTLLNCLPAQGEGKAKQTDVSLTSHETITLLVEVLKELTTATENGIEQLRDALFQSKLPKSQVISIVCSLVNSSSLVIELGSEMAGDLLMAVASKMYFSSTELRELLSGLRDEASRIVLADCIMEKYVVVPLQKLVGQNAPAEPLKTTSLLDAFQILVDCDLWNECSNPPQPLGVVLWHFRSQSASISPNSMTSLLELGQTLAGTTTGSFWNEMTRQFSIPVASHQRAILDNLRNYIEPPKGVRQQQHFLVVEHIRILSWSLVHCPVNTTLLLVSQSGASLACQLRAICDNNGTPFPSFCFGCGHQPFIDFEVLVSYWTTNVNSAKASVLGMALVLGSFAHAAQVVSSGNSPKHKLLKLLRVFSSLAREMVASQLEGADLPPIVIVMAVQGLAAFTKAVADRCQVRLEGQEESVPTLLKSIVFFIQSLHGGFKKQGGKVDPSSPTQKLILRYSKFYPCLSASSTFFLKWLPTL